MRLHDAQLSAVETVIREEVPEIKGLEQNTFAYVTWQGYTEETLYWFDNNGHQLTTRGIETLDYDAAKDTAKRTMTLKRRRSGWPLAMTARFMKSTAPAR